MKYYFKRQECNHICTKRWCYKTITIAVIVFIIIGLIGTIYRFVQAGCSFDAIVFETCGIAMLVQVLLWSAMSWRDIKKDIENRIQWGQWY